MAENEPLTPEKQLLRLIENPKQAAVRVASIHREGKKWFSFSALRAKLDFWQGASAKSFLTLKKLGKGSFGLRSLNQLLWFLLILAGLYTVYSIWTMISGVEKASRLILTPDKVVSRGKEIGIEFLGVEHYLDKIRGRNIFTAAPPEQEKDAPVAVEAPVAAPAPEDIAEYALVGIAWSDSPEAMIEDAKTKKTFFVKRGQILQNNIRVVSILKDRVVLSRDGKEFELS